MRSNDKILCEKKFTKEYVENGVKCKIVAVLHLHHIEGNNHPYFSITGTIYEARNGYWKDEAGGCIHEDIAKQFPELAKWIPLHLSDEDGSPMYAFENGAFHAGFCMNEFYAKDGSCDAKPQVVADHLRIDLETAKKLCFDKSIMFEKTLPEQKDEFKKFVESQKERWLKEANDFKEFLQTP